MAAFNTLIWNTKDSARAQYPPIEKADEKHKRDLSRSGENGGARCGLILAGKRSRVTREESNVRNEAQRGCNYTFVGAREAPIHSFIGCEAPQSMHFV
jgi:hypothetical protein